MKHRRALPIGILVLSTLTSAIVNAEAGGQPPAPHSAIASQTLPDADIEIPGNSGAQTGAIEQTVVAQDVSTGKGQQLPPGQIRAGEVRQNGVAQIPPDHGGPMTPKAGDIEPPMNNISVQLGFTPNSVHVIAAQEASGTLPEQQYVNGEYLYVVYENDEVLYAGTFNDPLLEHSLARNDKEVHRRKMSEGSIAVRIPASVLTAKNSAAYLQIFELGPDVEQSEILNKNTAQNIADRSTPFGESISIARIKAKLAKHDQ